MPIAEVRMRAAPEAKISRKGGDVTAERARVDRELNAALGKPESLANYHDCLQGAALGWRDPLRQ